MSSIKFCIISNRNYKSSLLSANTFFLQSFAEILFKFLSGAAPG